MQVLNLIREFEMQRMKETETIKDYSDRLLSIVNKVRLLGTKFSDSRIVQKIFIIVPEKFETTISSLENSKDVSSITLAELLNALQAHEQMRLIKQEGSVEGAFQAIYIDKKEMQSNNNNINNTQKFPPCPYCKKSKHPQKKVLVEARCKMSQVWSTRACGMNMKISIATRRSQDCCGRTSR